MLSLYRNEVVALTVPQPCLQIFDGNPGNYCDFIKSLRAPDRRKNVQHKFAFLLSDPIHIRTCKRTDAKLFAHGMKKRVLRSQKVAEREIWAKL